MKKIKTKKILCLNEIHGISNKIDAINYMGYKST